MFTTLIALAVVSQASIQLDRGQDNSAVIRIVGGGAGSVSVHVVDPSSSNLPAVLGTSATVGDDLVFAPRYPFQKGVEYRIEFTGDTQLAKIVRVPEASSHPASFVMQVYPSAKVLPANQLKLYVDFSAPMSRGVAYRHIHLRDAAGREVEHAFLELGEELWDSDQQRFTLLFDPGRIKRDLVPNHDDGTPLQAGHRYVLEIDATWPDSNGMILQSGWKKHFAVTRADREAPDPSNWSIVPPAVSSRDRLTVSFPEPLDYGLLQHTLRVTDQSGAAIDGSIAIDTGEKRWHFTPAHAWHSGDYSLAIDGSLEDLAGNRIGRLFEVDTRASAEKAKQPIAKTVSLNFTVTPSHSE